MPETVNHLRGTSVESVLRGSKKLPVLVAVFKSFIVRMCGLFARRVVRGLGNGGEILTLRLTEFFC